MTEQTASQQPTSEKYESEQDESEQTASEENSTEQQGTEQQGTEQPGSEQLSAEESARVNQRVNRRVTWSQPGAAQPVEIDDEVVDTSSEDWPDRELNPDEKLRRDKPPHWK